MRSTWLPSAFQKASSLSTASASAPGSGVRMVQRPSNRSSSAASGPEFSVPATGWAGTKCTPFGMCGSMSAITVCFTEPTSEMMQPGLSDEAIASVAGPQAPTGVQTITRSASSTAAARSVPQWSTSFSLLASAAVSGLRVAATILLARPRLRASSAIEPPIRPMPISAILLNSGPLMLVSLAVLAAIFADEARQAILHQLHFFFRADGDAEILRHAVARDHARDQPVAHQPVVGGRRALLGAEAHGQEVGDAGQRLQAKLDELGAEPGELRVVIGAARLCVSAILESCRVRG